MFYFTTDSLPAWADIESFSVTPKLPLNLYIYSANIRNLRKQTRNPIVLNMINVWYKVREVLKEKHSLSRFSPIWGNDNFKPGRADPGFRLWANNRLSKVEDLYNGEVMMTFEELRAKFDVPNKHFFKYLQVRSFITTAQNQKLSAPPLSIMERAISSHCYGKGQISFLYDMLVSGSTESSVGRLNAWREDIQEDVSLEEWGSVCAEAHSQTVNTRLKLLQFNWLMRTYITPVKLHKFNSNIPDTCIKCEQAIGTLFHCMWECGEITKFWREVSHAIFKMLGIHLPLHPKLFILGIYPTTPIIQTKKKALINMCLLQAKRLIALSWKNLNGPHIGQWLRGMSSCLSMEKITYILKGKREAFDSIWEPFIHFLENVDVSDALQGAEETGNV